MSKFLLLAGLVLGSLAGVSGVIQAGETSQPAPVESAQSVEMKAVFAAFGSTDHGSFTRFTDAIPTRTYWRSKGYAANIVTGADGNYTVRVFDR